MSSEKQGAYPEQNMPASAPPPYGVSDPHKMPQPAYQPGYPPAPQATQGYTAYPIPPSTNTVVIGRPPVSNPPSDYLVWSVITTICCCFWFGIAAIIKSVRARDAIASGDAAGAEEASRSARTCNILGTVFGIITITGIIVYYAVAGSSIYSYSY